MASAKNTHVMAHNLGNEELTKKAGFPWNPDVERVEEVRIMKNANFDNFIFMDDKD